MTASQIEDSAKSHEPAHGSRHKFPRVYGVVHTAMFGIAYQGPTAGVFFLAPVALVFLGPAAIWTLPIILIAQLLVMLVWREVVSTYPLEGGIYQWARALAGDRLGFIAGLFYFVALVVVLTTVGLVATGLLNGLFPSFSASTGNQVLVTIVFMILLLGTTLLSQRAVALLNTSGVIAELAVLFGAGLILLIGHRQHGLSVLVQDEGALAGHNVGYGMLIAIAVMAALMLGSETAGIFAEEVKDSRRTSGRAMVIACLAVAVSAAVFMLGLILATRDLKEAIAHPELWIAATLNQAFGSTGAAIFLVGALVATFSTGVATLSAAGRVLFGIVRESYLPGSEVITRLNRKTGQPVVALTITAALSLVPLVYASKAGVLAAAITGSLVTTYVLVIGALLFRRARGWQPAAGGFSLGRWAWPVNIIAFVWVFGLFIDLLWKRDATNPDLGPLPVLWEAIIAIALVSIPLYALGATGRRNAKRASIDDVVSGLFAEDRDA